MPLPLSLGDDVTLRLVRLEDASGLAAAYVRNREHLAPWDPTRDEDFFTPRYQEIEAARSLAAHSAGTALPLVLAQGDEIVGRVNLTGIVFGPLQSAVLGYWVDAALVGRGIMSRAVEGVLAIARDDLGLHRVEAGTLLHNAASRHVLRRAGFEAFGVAPHFLLIGGRWQDHILFQRLLHD